MIRVRPKTCEDCNEVVNVIIGTPLEDLRLADEGITMSIGKCPLCEDESAGAVGDDQK